MESVPVLSSQDGSGRVQLEGFGPTRNRKVVGSNPTSGSKTAGQRVCTVLPPMVLLASLIIPCAANCLWEARLAPLRQIMVATIQRYRRTEVL
jgi:hypothetical protein